MGTPQRILVGIAATLIVLTLAAGVAAGIYVKNAGMVVVQVAERGGDNINLKIPAAALELASWCIPDAVFGCVNGHMAPWLPTLDPVFDQLRSLPDFVMVDVVSPREKVRIETRGGRLVVRAVSPGDQIHLSIPIRIAGKIMHRIERLSGARGEGCPAAAAAIAVI
jgi:hypothetical protein